MKVFSFKESSVGCLLMAFMIWLGTAGWAAGATPPLVPFDSTADLLVLEDDCDCVLRITPEGDISIEISQSMIEAVTGSATAQFTDSGLALDANGNVFFTEQDTDSVLRWDGSALTQIIDESDVLAATGNTSADLEGLAVGTDGMVYVNDRNDDSVLQVDPAAGTVSVYVAESDFTALAGVTSVDFEAPIVAADNDVIFVFSSGTPDALFRLDGPGSPVLVTETDPDGLDDPENHATRAPNGDLITGDDDSPDQYYRITPAGDISVFLDEALLDTCASDTIDTSAGITFDDAGDFYWGDEDSNSIYVVDGSTLGDATPDCQLFVSAADIEAVTGGTADVSGGIAFMMGQAPFEPNEVRSVPLMGTWSIVFLGALFLVLGSLANARFRH